MVLQHRQGQAVSEAGRPKAGRTVSSEVAEVGCAAAEAAPRPRRGRRPQAERRAAMQAKLLDAAVSCLVELGWAGTSLPKVVKRAGVGRGAQVHHFPTKHELIAAAGDRLLERQRREFVDAFAALPPGERTVEAALDVLWRILCGPTWTAVMELGLASRTDPDVALSFSGFTAKVDATVLEVVGEYFPELVSDPARVAAVRGAVALLIGLAVQRSVDGDPSGVHTEVLSYYKQLFGLLHRSLPSSQGSRRERDPTGAPDPSEVPQVTEAPGAGGDPDKRHMAAQRDTEVTP